MQCYTELLPPSGVTHAVSVPFISATSSNVVVAKTSLLQIFSVIDVTPGENGKPEDKARRLDRPQNGKLVLVAEYALSGTVTDMSRVKILNSKSGGEAILIAFRNAKLSLIEWDPERHAISTISIHYYEKEDLTRSPWVPDLSSCGSHLTVDPTSRCAILNFGIRNLAIIPFHQPGDDLVMDDYDPSLDGDHEAMETSETTNKEQQIYRTPYGSSFVLPLTALEPSLLHPISLAFLYEYREPTFGILYSQVATSNALLHERKDAVFYAVFTLDLEQRASTTLLSVARLPSDLFKVVALPSPVGGALLIGTNELVHVDQAGKTNAVGVNEFSRQVSAFSMADQSDLALRLEGCHIEQLDMDKGDLILVLSTGDMILVSFKLDGRSVSGLSVRPISTNGGGNILEASPSCSATLSHNRIFFGSEDADSVLLSWSDTSATKSRVHKRQGADDAGEISDFDEDEDDYNYEDDLYSTAPSGSLQDVTSRQDSSVSGSYNFRLHDRLSNLGPLRDITLGKSQKSHKANSDNSSATSAELELVASHGSGRSGGLVVLKRELDPHVINSLELDHLDCLWSVTVNDRAAAPNNGDGQMENEVSRYVILSRLESDDKEESLVYALIGSKLEPFKAPEFNPNKDYTIDIGTLANRTRVVQVLRSEVRSYDANLGLAQIYPVWDEDTSDERVVVAASFADPYLVILRDDATLLILQADASGDLDEVSLPEEINETRWLSCSLYKDTQSFFSPRASAEAADSLLLFALNSECKLSIFQLPDLQSVSVIECVDSLLPILSKDAPLRRSPNRETLTEICVADLGDKWSRSPYLIVRTGTDDLAIYRPFMATDNSTTAPGDLHFLKESNHALPRFPSEAVAKSTASAQVRPRPLRSLPDVSGFSAVFMPGASPSFIFKAAVTTPHVIRLRADDVRGLSGLHVPDSEAGFVYLDSDNTVRLCQLPRDIQFHFPWAMRKIRVGEEIDHLAYSSCSETYILGTSHKADFKLPDDDEVHTEWRNEVISFLPQVDQSSVKIISPKTWSIIDSHPFAPAERIMAVKNINLEVSEHTHERRDLIVVGTAFARGEDIASRGCIYVFDVIEVVPDPERPEATRRLKLVGKEPVKGAVTGLSGIGGQGFLIVAQGQKCMVRGLKEDGSLLPVAFMDMQCYVNVVKELKGTGLCILGDALKGLWFTGYSEDPYKMTLFGKDTDYLEVVAADFLPDGDKLYILVADSECNLHVLQYDPEDPKSSNGDRLLDRSTFHLGHFASTMTLLPRTVVSSELVVSNSDEMDIDLYIPRHQVLVTTQTGLIGLVTPVSEESYRRLSALQSQLINTLEHPCGLNPRAYRAIESDGIGGRGMIDGTLLQRWLDLGRQRKTEIAARVGADEWEIKADLEAVSGAGLGYL